MNLQKPGKIDKGWGFEIIFSNNEKYCGKLLVFTRVGAKTSLVFHKERFKSWFINSGKFKITFIDVATGDKKDYILEEGKTADFGPLVPHQLESLTTNGIIFEVSTGDYIEDRFRLESGDTQKLPVELQSNHSS